MGKIIDFPLPIEQTLGIDKCSNFPKRTSSAYELCSAEVSGVNWAYNHDDDEIATRLAAFKHQGDLKGNPPVLYD